MGECQLHRQHSSQKMANINVGIVNGKEYEITK